MVPAPRTILNGVKKLPPATVRVVEPDGSHVDRLYWEPTFGRDPDRADWTDQDWQEALLDSLRVAVERRMVADVPVGVLLSGGIDSSLVVALLAEMGQTDLQTFSIGFDSAGGESGDEFAYSSLVAERFGTDHHQILIDSSRLLPGIDATVAAMSEPMVSHDCVAFYLLSEDVSRSVKVVQSGQGADEVLGGYDWYPPLAEVPRDQAVEAYARVFFDRRWDAMAGVLRPEWLLDYDAPTAFVAERFGRPGAETAVDAALRNDTTIMLVDDPVKRVDNMTMAWGLEARVPFLDHELVELAGRIPPELKLADGGKGVLKRASRGVVPDEVIDRTKGYFPVPAIRQLEGPYLERVREALTRPTRAPAGPVRRRPRRDPACRPQPHPDHARLERAVAAGPARDVAAAARCRVSGGTAPAAAPAPPSPALALADALVEAWGSWGPTIDPDVPPDRLRQRPQRHAVPVGGRPALRRRRSRRGPARTCPRTRWSAVNWSADGGWLAVCVATDGGVRTQVWVVRPDGSQARLIAGSAEQHAELGPWTRSGHRVVVTLPGEQAGEPTTCSLADPATGALTRSRWAT